jgi:hypothetical protein
VTTTADEDLTPIHCYECDKEITYSGRHWSAIVERWFCVDCWTDRDHDVMEELWDDEPSDT